MAGKFLPIPKKFLLIFISVLITNLFTFLAPQSLLAQIPSGFVQRDADKLILNGQTYKFIGFNKAGAANDNRYYSCGDGGDNPDVFLSTMFSTFKNICSNQNTNFVLRVWFTQAFTTRNNALDWSRIDRVINYAKQNNVRLIVTLENEWENCTKSMTNSANGEKLNDWYKEGYRLWNKDHPQNNGYNYPLTFREYVRTIVNRYKDEPTILAWQIMNEAESADRSGISDPLSLYNFTKDIASLIKSIDHNHLVSLGTIGDSNAGLENGNYLWMHSIPEIDILETHEYKDPNNPLPEPIPKNNMAAKILGKPIFMGEAGIYANDSAVPPNIFTYQQRASLFSNKMNAYFSNGGDGYLIWNWTNVLSTPGSQNFTYYQVDSDDPVCTTLFKNFNPPVCETNHTCYPNEIPKTIKMDWESPTDLNGWSGSQSPLTLSTQYKKNGNQSMRWDIDLSNSVSKWDEESISKSFATPQNWSGQGEKVKVYIYIPQNQANTVTGDFAAKVYLYNGSTSTSSASTGLAPGIWNEVTINSPNLTNITRVQIKVAKDREGFSYTGPIFVDFFHLTSSSNSADANNDGQADGIDYMIWLTNFGQNGRLEQGDFNGDGIINISDLFVWIANYTY